MKERDKIQYLLNVQRWQIMVDVIPDFRSWRLANCLSKISKIVHVFIFFNEINVTLINVPLVAAYKDIHF